MRADSTGQWREFLSNYARLHIYTADPGAHAIALELAPLAEDLGKLAGWFAEGWSAAHRPECRPASELQSTLDAGSTLLLGSQTNFARTQSVLTAAKAAGAATVFVFDHWKNYREHFGDATFPDVVVVPDQVAREQFLAALDQQIPPGLRVLPHPGIDAAAQRVGACGVRSEEGAIALLLDPTEPEHGLGYDWRIALAFAVSAVEIQPGARLFVKPHPRQDVEAVAREIALLSRSNSLATLYNGETERLIARSAEVWGMTTSALNVALIVGKPIKSLQIGRSAAGRRMSNPHIEPFVVT